MDRPGLEAWGRALGASLGAGDLVALRGDLGAGKTTLARAIAQGAGVTDDVTSPTFGLVHRHHAARAPLWHIDLYRIEAPAELVQLGWDEITAGEGIVLVEWPERAGAFLPVPQVEVQLATCPDAADVRHVRAH